MTTEGRRATILIIESDRDVRTMLELTFSYNGASYQVSTAPSGRSALLQFGIVRPDIILLDLDMPDGDGWETLGRIRDLSTVPIIAVSGVHSPETQVRSLDAGADYCLIKPFGLRELHARVRALLRRDQSAMPSWHSTAADSDMRSVPSRPAFANGRLSPYPEGASRAL